MQKCRPTVSLKCKKEVPAKELLSVLVLSSFCSYIAYLKTKHPSSFTNEQIPPRFLTIAALLFDAVKISAVVFPVFFLLPVLLLVLYEKIPKIMGKA